MTDQPYTEEEEREVRLDAADTGYIAASRVRRLLATLDAERAAHEETRRKWDDHAAGRASVARALREELRAEWAGNDAAQDALAAARSEVEALRGEVRNAHKALLHHFVPLDETQRAPLREAPLRDLLRIAVEHHTDHHEREHAEATRLRAEVERLRERCAQHEEDARRVLSEACATDEVHCSCVPVLRAEVERLRAGLLDMRAKRDHQHDMRRSAQRRDEATRERAIAAEARVRELEGRLRDLLRWAEARTCVHDDTYRAGAIWEICRRCGEKWADDEGGKPPFEDPAPIAAAHDALAPHPPQQQTPAPADEER